MKIKDKAYIAIKYGDKIPRKVKKKILGKRLSKKYLKLKLNVISNSKKTVYDLLQAGEIESLFCPKCGCEVSYSINYDVEYPEVWNEGFCARCGNKVEMQDNSPCCHVLDCENLRFD